MSKKNKKKQLRTSTELFSCSLDQIPDDIILEIFSFLQLPYSLLLFLVCKRFRKLILHNSIFWKECCLRWWNNNSWRRFSYNLEKAKQVSNKEWIFFARCFSNGKITRKKICFWSGQGSSYSYNDLQVIILPTDRKYENYLVVG